MHRPQPSSPGGEGLTGQGPGGLASAGSAPSWPCCGKGGQSVNSHPTLSSTRSSLCVSTTFQKPPLECSGHQPRLTEGNTEADCQPSWAKLRPGRCSLGSAPHHFPGPALPPVSAECAWAGSSHGVPRPVARSLPAPWLAIPSVPPSPFQSPR